MKLVFIASGNAIELGNPIIVNEGGRPVQHTVVDIEQPASVDGTGAIYLKGADGHIDSYKPSAIDAEWQDNDEDDAVEQANNFKLGVTVQDGFGSFTV